VQKVVKGFKFCFFFKISVNVLHLSVSQYCAKIILSLALNLWKCALLPHGILLAIHYNCSVVSHIFPSSEVLHCNALYFNTKQWKKNS